jgi:hypothetical protein
MDILNFVLAVLGAVSMLYKIYLQDKLHHPEKKSGWGLLWRRSRPLNYFFPINRNFYAFEDYPLVRKANFALFVAYGIILIAFLLSENYLKISF